MAPETIVAIATPAGEGGLAVVRLSGPRAFDLASRIFRGRGFKEGQPTPRRAVYGILHHPVQDKELSTKELDIIDQVLALPLAAPASYTGEDTVEFFCHGGREAATAAVAASLAAGAVPAPPGEFTRRAFLNGRLSLDQAEAVADLIQAESRHAARAAVRQMRGGLDNELSEIEAPLLHLLSRLEGSLEFTDEEDPGPIADEIVAVLDESTIACDRLLSLAPAGRLLREGVHVVLVGAPNTGKSSLFNLLLAEERALVDDEAGTTRDVITARVRRDGGSFVLHDTAGLRDGAGRVERLGMERTWRSFHEADIVLSLCEAGKTSTSSDAITRGDVPVIAVLTKSDLTPNCPVPIGAVLTSSHTGRGRDELWTTIDHIVDDYRLHEAMELGVLLNERHRHKLCGVGDELSRLSDEIRSNDPGAEVVATMLSSLLADLGEISGRVFSEQLLESIFSRFCVGK